MTKLVIEEKHNPKLVELGQKLFEIVGGDFYKVVVRLQWIRVSLKKGVSLYVFQLNNGLYKIDIETKKSLAEFLPAAICHWGPADIKPGPIGGCNYHYWEMSMECLETTLKQVMLGEVKDQELIKDVGNILSNSQLLGSEKQALVKVRIGHSKFALAVKQSYASRCAVFSVIDKNLTASHIKPWRDSSDKEKVDPNNGICLSPNMDALFDSGFISFSDDGRLLTYGMTKEELKAYNLTGQEQIDLKPRQIVYLDWHRQHVFCSIPKNNA